MSHVYCPACGLFGRKAARAARRLRDEFLVNWAAYLNGRTP